MMVSGRRSQRNLSPGGTVLSVSRQACGPHEDAPTEGWIIPQHSTPDAAIQIFLHYLKRREENSGSFQLLVTLLLTILEPPLPLFFTFFFFYPYFDY